MEILVYSRGAIERLPPHDVPHVIVSITTTSDDEAELPIDEHCKGVLRLAFLDAESLPADAPGQFTSQQASAICVFVQKHRLNVRRIVVHCDAGVSRSPAVAAALAVCLGKSDEEFFRRYRPNMFVYRCLLNEWRRLTRA